MKKDNYLKINDLLTFSFLNPELTHIKDDFDNKKGIFAGNKNIEDIEAKGLKVRIAATHAGIVTRNNMFYLPDKVRKGVGTFIKDYNKPVLLHHDERSDAIGRIIDAFYVDTSRFIKDNYSNVLIKDGAGNELNVTNQILQDFCDGSMPFGMQVDLVRNLFTRPIKDKLSLLENKSYEGLGHNQIITDITDPEAIQKFLDGRYLTGSVGAVTDMAICSICKQNWIEDEFCEHQPGAFYDDIKMVLIAGNFFYDEYSVANTPADRHSKVLELYCNGNVKNIEIKNEYVGGVREIRPEFPQYDLKEERMAARLKEDTEKIKDSVQEELEIVSCAEEKSVKELLDVLLSDNDFLDEDREYLYDLVFVKDEKVDTEDWDQVSKEMEEYANSLKDVEDTVLDGYVLTEEEIKDAEKKKPQDKPGGSNVGKYKKGPFCGPAGGAPKGSYPVNTLKRAKAALSYARHAPNPAGIRKCVCRHWGKQLPSCQAGKKKKDHANLRKSAFCGPKSTFPVVDCEDVKTIHAVLDQYKDKDGVAKILKNVDRKAKAFGCTKKLKKSKDGLNHARMLHMVTAVVEEHMWTKTGLENADKDPLLSEEEVKSLTNILKRLAAAVGKDNFIKALSDKESVELKDVIKTFQDMDLLEEIMSLEENLGELREEFEETKDSRDALREEYDLLQGETDSLRDELVVEKGKVRDVKIQKLDLFTSLKGDISKEEENRLVEFGKLTDEALNTRLEELTSEVDIKKIAGKLSDGTSRVPEGSIEDPVLKSAKHVLDGENLGKRFEKMQERYIEITLGESQVAAEQWLNRQFTNMIKGGELPKEIAEKFKENILKAN